MIFTWFLKRYKEDLSNTVDGMIKRLCPDIDIANMWREFYAGLPPLVVSLPDDSSDEEDWDCRRPEKTAEEGASASSKPIKRAQPCG